MKKIFALVLSLGTLSSVFAQQGNHRDDNYRNSNDRGVYNSNEHEVNYSYNVKQRDAEIKQINRDFDSQVWAIRNDRRMRPAEKNRQIAMLERQRNQRIEQTSARYATNKNYRYDDRVANNNRRF